VNQPQSNRGAVDLDDLTTVQLIDRLTTQVSELVRTEVSHAVGEVKTKSTAMGVGIGISGAGVLLLVYGLGAVIATAILGLATVVSPWVAAAIVAIVVLAVGGILAALGASRAKAAAPPVPERTTASVRQDVQTVKDHL
jgi:membrane protein